MNSKQRKVLALVYKDPIPKSLEWLEIESLLLAVGAELIEGNGSRVRFHKDHIVAAFHRPHPKKEELTWHSQHQSDVKLMQYHKHHARSILVRLVST